MAKQNKKAGHSEAITPAKGTIQFLLNKITNECGGKAHLVPGSHCSEQERMFADSQGNLAEDENGVEYLLRPFLPLSIKKVRKYLDTYAEDVTTATSLEQAKERIEARLKLYAEDLKTFQQQNKVND